MVRIRCVLVAALGLSAAACGSSASLEFGDGAASVADAGDESPYPDAAPGLGTDAGKDAAEDAGAPKCPPGKDGKGNVCVRVLRGTEGPTINDDVKALGLDGRGAVLVGLSAIKPGRQLTFVAQTWFPGESSGAGKTAASELPKVAEPLAVAPGVYYAFAAFRDLEPYVRADLSVGDWLPDLSELPTVTVTAGGAVNVDVIVHPLRALDVDVHLDATPVGSGAGPLRAWLTTEGGKLVGEGSLPCANLEAGHVERVRVFTIATGTFDLKAALFDFASPTDLEEGIPSMSEGTLHVDPSSAPSVSIANGDWIAPGVTSLALDRVESITGPKPTDPTPTCTTASYAPAK